MNPDSTLRAGIQALAAEWEEAAEKNNPGAAEWMLVSQILFDFRDLAASQPTPSEAGDEATEFNRAVAAALSEFRGMDQGRQDAFVDAMEEIAKTATKAGILQPGAAFALGVLADKARIGPGASWRDVARRLDPSTLTGLTDTPAPSPGVVETAALVEALRKLADEFTSQARSAENEDRALAAIDPRLAAYWEGKADAHREDGIDLRDHVADAVARALGGGEA